MTTADIEEIKALIVKTVNGKIDRLGENIKDHNASHEVDMVQIRQHIAEVNPILIEYKERQAMRAYGKKAGDFVKWTAGVITAVGVIWALFFK